MNIVKIAASASVCVACIGGCSLGLSNSSSSAGKSQKATSPTSVDLIAAFAARAETIVVYEGLPHPKMETALFEREHSSGKGVHQLDWHWFYDEPITLTADDQRSLLKIIGAVESYRWSDWPNVTTACGGFHPDYAVEWKIDGRAYTLHLCFGCGEAELHGPGVILHCDLTYDHDEIDAEGKLRKLLEKYRKNCPKRGA